MKIWFQRTTALMLISLGISLIAFQFNYEQAGTIEKEVVRLQLEKVVNSEVLESQFSGIDIIDVTGPELNEEDYPCIWRVFNYLDEEWLSDSCTIDEWIKFEELVLDEKSDTNLILFRSVLSSCIKNKKNQRVSFYYLGEKNLDLQKLSETDLSRFPTIQKSIKELETGTHNENRTTIPLKEWNKMVDRYLEPMYDYQNFEYNKSVYSPDFSYDYEVKKDKFPRLPIILKLIGVLFLFIGLVRIKKLYIRKKGIKPKEQKLTLFSDGITLLLAVPSAWMISVFLLEKLLYIPPVYDDREFIFIGVFFFCFGIPLMARFTSRRAELNSN